MAKKTLNIVESAYRAVMEEQDDTILWLLAAMQGAGANHTVVLRGNAVNYAVAGQGAPGLAIGAWKQTQAPRMDHDLVDLIEKRKIPSSSSRRIWPSGASSAANWSPAFSCSTQRCFRSKWLSTNSSHIGREMAVRYRGALRKRPRPLRPQCHPSTPTAICRFSPWSSCRAMDALLRRVCERHLGALALDPVRANCEHSSRYVT
jgi:hypothetical protein